MDGAADLGPEDGVDAPVLLDPAQLRELRRHDPVSYTHLTLPTTPYV